MEYRIVRSKTLEDLEKDVNDAIGEVGWGHTSLGAAPNEPTIRKICRFYFQGF
ncbi:MAG: hypothetical protein CM1200mP21_02890 [Candidatus Poseidoniales archaeon]|nr:MAG: hypothetical protein CM1200mP21_02890 [Candidatus Poseidoniales archaeon]